MNIDSIFNRPPSVAEDTLQYALYPPPNQTDKVAVTSLAAYIKAYVENCLPNFIWHRDAFEVKLTQNNNNLESWFLGGRMRVGDSVDDEWCTIWLLRQLSSQWDLVIRSVTCRLPLLAGDWDFQQCFRFWWRIPLDWGRRRVAFMGKTHQFWE